MYELRIEKKAYNFNTAKEAYVFYLDNFATQEYFEYYKKCCNKNLYDIKNNEELIGMVFDNVFDVKHHIYKIEKGRYKKLY